MKTLLVVMDGAADRPHPDLGGRTPLEAARTPNLDRLARQGVMGTVRTAPPGIAPESDQAVFNLLGYPLSQHTGRGPLEAAGLGYRPRARHFLALRANFATLDRHGRLADRRAGRTLTSREARSLADHLNQALRLGARCRVLPGVAHRAVVVFERDAPFSARVTNTDPAYRVTKTGAVTAVWHYAPRVEPCRPLDRTAAARATAALINRFTSESAHLLRAHPANRARERRGEPPANVLLLRDAGTRFPRLAPRQGWALIADMPLEVGIGRLAGMRVIATPAPTFARHDYPDRARRALEALRTNQGVYVHLKGPDLHGHEGDARGKRRSFEDIDRGFFGALWRGLDFQNTRVIVTADHSTPCLFKAHASDAVPFLAAGAGATRDFRRRFTEREGRVGRAGELAGAQLLRTWGAQAKGRAKRG